MALQTQNGNYYRIGKEDIKSFLSNIRYNIYKDKQTRLNPTQWDIAPGESVQVENTDEFLNLVITQLYLNLKSSEKFINATDV